MKHLAAIVAIKVVNDGFGGDIKIKDVEFAVPDVYKTVNNGKIVPDANGNPIKLQDAFPIVGQFQVNMSNGQCTAIADNSFASTKFELPSAVSLKKGDALTFYLPVMPFSATKTISIKVNSSERAISKAVKLESGKVTTFKVPITALAHETSSDAFRMRSAGRQTSDNTHLTGNTYISPDGEATISSTIISTTGERQNIIVNGQSVEAYKLSGNTNTITITGFLSDLIQAIPVSFYVSTLGDQPAEMTVNSVTAWLLKYKSSEENIKYSGGLTGRKYKKFDQVVNFNEIESRGGAETNSIALITEGLNGHCKLTQTLIKEFASLERITFSNISQNGYYDETFKNSNVVVLNDGFANKEVNESNINGFLVSFKDNSNGHIASFDGLKKIAKLEQKALPSTVEYYIEQEIELTGLGYVTKKKYIKNFLAANGPR